MFQKGQRKLDRRLGNLRVEIKNRLNNKEVDNKWENRMLMLSYLKMKKTKQNKLWLDKLRNIPWSQVILKAQKIKIPEDWDPWIPAQK